MTGQLAAPLALDVTVVALTGAAAVWPRSRGRPDRRLRTVVRPVGAPGGYDPGKAGADSARHRVLLRRTALGLAVVALCSALGTAPGLVVGAVLSVVADRLLARLEPAAIRRRRAQLVEDLPALCDLLAVTVRAGVPTQQALTVCAEAVGGPLGGLVGQVATALALGADPVRAWGELAAEPVTAPLAAAMTRAARRGLAPGAALRSCAGQARRARAVTAARRAQAVGVSAAAPLGLCFLPAFVLVAVVPTVVSGLGQVIGS